MIFFTNCFLDLLSEFQHNVVVIGMYETEEGSTNDSTKSDNMVTTLKNYFNLSWNNLRMI